MGLSPYEYRAAWTLARAADLSGNPTLECQELETSAALWPAHSDLQRMIGLKFWERGERLRAATCLRRAFTQEPASVETVLEDIWRAGLTLPDYEALLPPLAPAYSIYAGSLLKRGFWKEALQAFDKGVPQGSSNWQWYDYFAAHLAEVGQWGIEAKIRDRRLSIKSDAWAYGASAHAWLKLGALERALERVLTATRIDPSNAQWFALRGEIQLAKGDRVAALEAYTSACTLAPTELQWRFARGLVELEDQAYVAAAEDLQEVLLSHPKHREATLGLARALAGQGKIPTSRLLLDEWLKEQPDDGAAKALRDILPHQ
jgi:tetratricopeptide (TPR) repeat protein